LKYNSRNFIQVFKEFFEKLLDDSQDENKRKLKMKLISFIHVCSLMKPSIANAVDSNAKKFTFS
jgi:hypothetical protein